MYPFFQANKSGDQNFFKSSILSNLSFPPHLHPYVEMIYVIEGSIDVTINKLSHCLSDGEATMCFPNDIHGYTTKNSSKIIMFIFSPDITRSFFGGIRMNKTLENPFIPKSIINNEIKSLFFTLDNEFKSNNNKYVVKGLLYTILGKLDPYFIIENSNPSYSNTTQNLLRYIEFHYQDNISLDSVAKDLGFSKFYISRIFSNKIGYQFNDYINRLRINKAEKLLEETDLPITTIALECGFETQRNFNRIFKELTSLTPTNFRFGKK